MQTYPIYSNNGQKIAFEIDNIYIGPRKIVKLLENRTGVSHLRKRRLFHSPSDIHVEFTYKGVNYIVWEPYGDSSRYWIGPKDEKLDIAQVANIESIFMAYKPPFITRIIGTLLMFSFGKFLKKGKKTGSSG